MRLATKAVISLMATAAFGWPAFGASITGSVTGPDGKPFMVSHVVAENPQTKMTVSVLSNQQGRHQIGNLPAATYKVRIDTIGYKSMRPGDVALAADPK